MEPLEVILRRVEDLKKDLSAEIVIQKEEGHYEPYWNQPTGSYNRDGDISLYVEPDGKRLVIDKPKIANPDEQKREAARTELQKIYDSSEWYSARYAAGELVGKKSNKDLDAWIADLENQLNSKRSMVNYKKV